MKYLTLFRHAKSAHDGSGTSDHDRRLNDRGERQCVLMAARISGTLPTPDRIIVSSARRAVETVERLLKELGNNGSYPEYEVESELYLADALDIREIADQAFTLSDDLWLCGHNPGITESVAYMTGTRIENVPTLGVVRILFDDELAEGELIYFDTPKVTR